MIYYVFLILAFLFLFLLVKSNILLFRLHSLRLGRQALHHEFGLVASHQCLRDRGKVHALQAAQFHELTGPALAVTGSHLGCASRGGDNAAGQDVGVQGRQVRVLEGH